MLKKLREEQRLVSWVHLGVPPVFRWHSAPGAVSWGGGCWQTDRSDPCSEGLFLPFVQLCSSPPGLLLLLESSGRRLTGHHGRQKCVRRRQRHSRERVCLSSNFLQYLLLFSSALNILFINVPINQIVSPAKFCWLSPDVAFNPLFLLLGR